MSISSRVVVLSSGSSSAPTGGGTVTLFQNTSVASLTTFDYDTTYGPETMLVSGTLGPYYGGSNGYFSIFLAKVLTSDGTVSSMYYDDHGATGAWFPSAELGIVDGSYYYNIGTMGPYRIGFGRYQFTSDWGNGSGYGAGQSTSFTNGGAVGKATNNMYIVGQDLFSGDYRAVVRKTGLSDASIAFNVSNTHITNVNDTATGLINDNSDNLYVSVAWENNKQPGLWKLNNSGSTIFSYVLNQSASIVVADSYSVSSNGKTIAIDSSNNIYAGMHCKAATAISPNNRNLAYIYSATNGGGLRWAKAFYRNGMDAVFNLNSVRIASDGNLWISGSVRDVPNGQTYGYWAKINAASGAIMSFTAFKNNTGRSGPFVSITEVRELPSGKLGLVGAWNGAAGGTERFASVLEIDTMGDFGDFAFEDWTSLVTEVPDTGANFSNRGTRSTYSVSNAYYHNPLPTSLTTSVITL